MKCLSCGSDIKHKSTEETGALVRMVFACASCNASISIEVSREELYDIARKKLEEMLSKLSG